MFEVLAYGKNGSINVPLKVNEDGELSITLVQQSYKVEALTIATLNVIPDLQFTPIVGAVTVVAAGGNTVPGVDWTISGKTITWNAGAAGYNLDPSDWVVVTYLYSA
jgi:hypothetical protein